MRVKYDEMNHLLPIILLSDSSKTSHRTISGGSHEIEELSQLSSYRVRKKCFDEFQYLMNLFFFRTGFVKFARFLCLTCTTLIAISRNQISLLHFGAQISSKMTCNLLLIKTRVQHPNYWAVSALCLQFAQYITDQATMEFAASQPGTNPLYDGCTFFDVNLIGICYVFV